MITTVTLNPGDRRSQLTGQSIRVGSGPSTLVSIPRGSDHRIIALGRRCTMLGTLDRYQIDHVQREATVGRIDGHDDGRTCAVPVSYVYDGDMANLHTVIAWGAYERTCSER